MMKPSRIFVLLFGFSLASTYGFASDVTPACIDKYFALRCPRQRLSNEVIWKYKNGENWHDIGDISKNKTNIWSNIQKFENVTMNISSDFSLVFPLFPAELSGMYRCQQWNDKGRLIHSSLHTVVAVKCEQTVCEDDNATIQCDLLKYKNLMPGLNNNTEIVWKDANEKLVSMSHDMTVTYQNPGYPSIGATSQGALTIKSASQDLNGRRYTCVIHGQNGVTARHYSVVINVQKCLKKADNDDKPTSLKNTNKESQSESVNTRKEKGKDKGKKDAVADIMFFLLRLIMVFAVPSAICLIVLKLRRSGNQRQQVHQV